MPAEQTKTRRVAHLMKAPRVADTEIFSIFGQIERVAAEILIEQGKATKIEPARIPAEAMFNSDGEPAVFAVMIVGRANNRLFRETVAELRA